MEVVKSGIVVFIGLGLLPLIADTIHVSMPSKWIIPQSASVSDEVRIRNEYYCKCYSALEKCVKGVNDFAVNNKGDERVDRWSSELKKSAKSYGWKHYKSGEPSKVPLGRKMLEDVMHNISAIDRQLSPPMPKAKKLEKKGMGHGLRERDSDNMVIMLANGLPAGTEVEERNGDVYKCKLPDGSYKFVYSEQLLTAPGAERGQVSGAVRPGMTYSYQDASSGEIKRYTIPDTRSHRQKKLDLRNERIDQAAQTLLDAAQGREHVMSVEDANIIIQRGGR